MGPTVHSRYQLELTQTPHQAKQTQGISCLEDKQIKISQDTKELLAKGAIVEAKLSTCSYISQIFLVEKKGEGQRPVINLKGLTALWNWSTSRWNKGSMCYQIYSSKETG